jgi:hypothetical protein
MSKIQDFFLNVLEFIVFFLRTLFGELLPITMLCAIQLRLT